MEATQDSRFYRMHKFFFIVLSHKTSSIVNRSKYFFQSKIQLTYISLKFDDFGKK
jgi:hypothetical protein